MWHEAIIVTWPEFSEVGKSFQEFLNIWIEFHQDYTLVYLTSWVFEILDLPTTFFQIQKFPIFRKVDFFRQKTTFFLKNLGIQIL